MVRTVEKKYQVWLAGYYDDFNGARAIPDDTNSPGSARAHGNSHHGNPMNGEATLNPRYRWSEPDRDQTGSNLYASSDNKLLQNDGIFEFISHDDTRQSNTEWEGRAQLQYPDGHVANRYRFDGSGALGYHKFVNGYDTLGSYLVPTGNNDATFGRNTTLGYTTTLYRDANGGTSKAGVTNASSDNGEFVQRAHLAGVWMGEQYLETSSTTPNTLFAEVTSPAKKPFLVVQSARYDKTNHAAKPTIVYDGPLNTRLDGDTFSTRVAVRAMSGKGGTEWTKLGLQIEVGFAQPTSALTDTGFTGTPAIDQIIPLNYTAGGISGGITYDTKGELYNSSGVLQSYTNDDTWLDIDLVFNYTDNNYDVYVDGVLKASNIAMNDAAKDGTADGATTAANLYGYQITVVNGESTSQEGYVSYMMLDRAGVVRYLTDDVAGGTDEAPITDLKMSRSVNGISSCSIELSDIPDLHTDSIRGSNATNYTHNLKDLFLATSALDWQLLIFGDADCRIDRPIWRGIIEKFDIKQKRRDRVLTFQASDALNIMDRAVPLWEIGQEALNDSETETPYWLYEAQGFKDTMNMGARRLKLLGPDVGFDIDSSFIETSTQRMQLGSGHPIQMYNNEDTLGPNSIEDAYDGTGILGFNEDASGNTEIHLSTSTHGLSHPVNITITNSTNHNGTYASSSVSGNKIVVAGGTLAVTGETAKIIYIGKAWGPFYEHSKYTSPTGTANDIHNWTEFIDPGKPSSAHFPTGNSADTHFIFDADPGLKEGDSFFVNGRDIGNSALSSSLQGYIGKHTVKQIESTKSYFAAENDNKIYWVKTHTPYMISHGEFGDYSGDSLKTGNDRLEFSKDTGTLTNVTTIPNRGLQAQWMRDLPMSLWFQYHFGKIKYAPVNNTFTHQAITDSQSLTSATTSLQVPQDTYDNIPNYGVAEIWQWPGTGRITDTNLVKRGKFIYQGKATSGGSYYLIGCKYMPTLTTFAHKLRVHDIDADYKHVWLLWADMRNNGKADADGSSRKSNFGLQYPVSDNYEFDLFYVDQFDTEGNIDKFASLKVGEDLSIWNIDSTTDPITNGAFSKPANYSAPQTVSSIANDSGKLKILTSETGTVAEGDYVHLIGTADHDGIHKVATGGLSNDTHFITETTFVSTTVNTGGAVYYPTTGSDQEASKYQDWEDKAGSFVVIDTAPFFNLNTHINNGKTGQTGGGRTDLTDYVAVNEGFPALIDNYWREATPSYLTTGDRALEHTNSQYLISDATFVSDLSNDGQYLEPSYKGLPVDNASIFRDSGYGMIRETDSEKEINDYYFSYDCKLESALPASGSYAVSNSPGTATYGGVTGTQEIVCNGETLHTDGVREGMVLERTKGSTLSYHSVLNMGEAADDTNFETTMVVTGSGWDNTCTFTVPIQLGKVYMTQLESEEINLALADNQNYPAAIRERFNAEEGDTWDIYGLKSKTATQERVEVHASFGSAYMLRLMMHVNGFVKSTNSGTFYESDKIRALWNAAITDSWLPPTRLNAIYDINNVPVTSIMTTYNDTSSNDSYGSMIQTRGKTLASILNVMRGKSGFGDTNSLKTTFSYLIGHDGRLEFRPKFNSNLNFGRTTMKVANFSSQMSAQISNVRVYYNGGASFIDFPKPGLTDTTRWKVLQYPSITNSEEAQLLAKQEYNKSKESPMQLTIEPILFASQTENKMIDGGRYGYIADPYISLKGLNADATAEYKWVTSWTRLGSGGVLFPGMVNALDGNQATTTDIYARYGGSAVDNTDASIAYNENYTWYGANSISYAVQIVNISNNMPLVNAAGHSMRMWVDLANQTGTSIDEAQFVINLGNYNFDNDRDKDDSLQGSISSITVKHSGFYQIDVPTTYDSSAGGKIVVSFNAEYCRALLRHRCGDPSQTAHGSANYILDSSVDNGSGSVNASSIFPLGLRKHVFQGGTMDLREVWYAPRVHICNDMAYSPATIVTVTDPGLGLNATAMVINQIRWSIKAGETDKVVLNLERDESIRMGGLITQLYNPNNQGPTMNTDHLDNMGLNDTGGGAGTPLPPSNTPSTDTTPTLVGGGTVDFNQQGFGNNDSVGIGQWSSTSYGRSVRGRMDMRDLGNSNFSILGMKPAGETQTAMRGIEGMDVSINATGGSAFLGAEGYVFGGKGKRYTGDSFAGNLTSQIVSLQTQFTTPEDVVNDNLSITAKVSCGIASPSADTAVLETTATIVETGVSVSHTTSISTNTDKKEVSLIPLTSLLGLKTPKQRVEVTIVRKPGTGSDDADTSSVVLHNLDVRMERGSVPGKVTSAQFSTFS